MDPDSSLRLLSQFRLHMRRVQISSFPTSWAFCSDCHSFFRTCDSIRDAWVSWSGRSHVHIQCQGSKSYGRIDMVDTREVLYYTSSLRLFSSGRKALHYISIFISTFLLFFSYQSLYSRFAHINKLKEGEHCLQPTVIASIPVPWIDADVRWVVIKNTVVSQCWFLKTFRLRLCHATWRHIYGLLPSESPRWNWITLIQWRLMVAYI